ncbi:MAG: ferritin family protein [Candidatus Thermoplasmatota archaeon]|jgi:rubrerythrin|nr:ferritin family protein [Candidatus Thermoplasmatota archaeon]
MDLEHYSMKDLLLTAIKSEIESNMVYTQLSEKVANAFLKDRLLFLASEERKHKEFLEGLYREMFNEYDISLPVRSPVPLPEVRVSGKHVMVSDVMLQAMASEKAASEFYAFLSENLEDEDKKRTMHYLSSMEMGHYRILELEQEQLSATEDYEVEWGMMHAGP